MERVYIQGPLCRLGNFYSFLEQGRGHGVWTECLWERLEYRYEIECSNRRPSEYHWTEVA